MTTRAVPSATASRCPSRLKLIIRSGRGWHWGGGELANNGIHALDEARWGLGVDYPARVTFNGGRYHYDDDQETPDTGAVVYDFGSKGAMWDVSSCLPRSNE